MCRRRYTAWFLSPFFLFLMVRARKSHTIRWETRNPIFRIDNTDHIMDVNRGNSPWEYDQVNIVCPVYPQGTADLDMEKHIIYSVSKEEYESCRITNPNPRIIAVCDNPSRLLYFTISFRSFTPQPGGLEFRPGEDYYFISTSTTEDLHRRVGGRCKTHNMKVVFKICCSPEDEEDNRLPGEETTTARKEEEEREESNAIDFPAVSSLLVEESGGDESSRTSTRTSTSTTARAWTWTSLGAASLPESEESNRYPTYKNYGFPIFSIKVTPRPRSSDYYYMEDRGRAEREQLKSSASAMASAVPLTVASTLVLVIGLGL